jgi:hypothetical protein
MRLFMGVLMRWGSLFEEDRQRDTGADLNIIVIK